MPVQIFPKQTIVRKACNSTTVGREVSRYREFEGYKSNAMHVTVKF